MGRGPGHQNKYNPGYHKGDNRAGGGGERGGGGKHGRPIDQARRSRRGGREIEEEREKVLEES